MTVNGNIIQAVRVLACVAQDQMAGESERLDAVKSLVEIPEVFSTEISLVNRELESVRKSLEEISTDTMTTTKGKVRAANLTIKLETLILGARE